ncbi:MULTISPECIES: DUF4357 domain-containing protein [Nosocomiicoccus]|uniref:DUF4357 domain-containing protein n=1 Tax=Nosocomiicoccus massiliensis TaxID=1232430 RepID=A0AAF0YHD2_9STAP|nr:MULTISPECIES: DUF4357 domain-containing protein [Nosocomiicoccus]WOS95460.1 DUF4357 domain-containing protein [Nosocomiicoccus massiliensis]
MSTIDRGIIYVMSTAVPGLVKIGKTGVDNFENRMNFLERNGYFNVVALDRKFAIEVEDYHAKEVLLDDIFKKSKVSNSELYALDIDLVIQLLSSFEGRQVFPIEKSKEETFDDATKEVEMKRDTSLIPDGEYVLNRRVRGFGEVRGIARVEDGVFTVLKGSLCAPDGDTSHLNETRRLAHIVDNILQEDVICTSPSTAGFVIIGNQNNGWMEWKTRDGKPLDIFRTKK